MILGLIASLLIHSASLSAPYHPIEVTPEKNVYAPIQMRATVQFDDDFIAAIWLPLNFKDWKSCEDAYMTVFEIMSAKGLKVRALWCDLDGLKT
jgi:hypothetical protein